MPWAREKRLTVILFLLEQRNRQEKPMSGNIFIIRRLVDNGCYSCGGDSITNMFYFTDKKDADTSSVF